MVISEILVYLVIAIQILLIMLTIYFYSSYKLRIFLFIGLGFIALLMASLIPIVLSDIDTGIYTTLLNVGAGLFFLTGTLTAV